MRTQWEALYESFDILVRSADAHSFARDATSHPALAAFGELGELLGYLLERSSDLDLRDQVVAALVRLARIERTRDVATALVWLTVWPGLCRAYHRARRNGANEREALSAIGFALTTQLHELELARVNRIVATLVRNTERNALASLRIGLGDEALDEDLPILACDPTENLRSVWRTLDAAVGRDAELVFRVVLFDESHDEVATRLGISPVAARKRYQRSLERAREHYAKGVAA